MIVETLFLIDTFSAFFRVKRRYHWKDNLDITLLSYCPLFIFCCLWWAILGMLSVVYVCAESDILSKEVPIYSTAGNYLGLTSFIVILGLVFGSFFLINIFEKKIQLIEDKYQEVVNKN